MANAWNRFWNTVVNLLGVVDHTASAFNHVAEMADEEAHAFAQLSAISREDRVSRERARLAAIAAA